MTNAASEKYDKQMASRRTRRWMDAHVSPHAASADDFDLVSYEEHPRSGGFTFRKDGKVWLGNSRSCNDTKWLRK
jgi:hypothetical protein